MRVAVAGDFRGVAVLVDYPLPVHPFVQRLLGGVDDAGIHPLLAHALTERLGGGGFEFHAVFFGGGDQRVFGIVVGGEIENFDYRREDFANPFPPVPLLVQRIMGGHDFGANLLLVQILPVEIDPADQIRIADRPDVNSPRSVNPDERHRQQQRIDENAAKQTP